MEKKTIKKRGFRMGGYSVLISAIVLAIIIAANLVIGQLPATWTQFDISANDIYSISDKTLRIAEGLEEDVTIYLLAEPGGEDQYISRLLNRYEALSERIKVVTKDPVLHSGFVRNYTDEELQANSVIVESSGRFKVIAYSDIYVTETDYSTYYTTGSVSYTTNYCGEDEITGAILYVTMDKLPTVYQLTGHGEASLPQSVAGRIEDINITLSDLSLLTSAAVPEDCSALLITAPATDIGGEELSLILEYLEAGGRLMLITDYGSLSELPNIAVLMENYGLRAVGGMVFEGDSDCYYQYVNWLLPVVESHTATEPLIEGGYRVLLPDAHGIEELPSYRGSLSIAPLLSSSDLAFAREDISDTSTEKGADDVPGPFYLAAAATEAHDGGESTMVAWFGSGTIINEDLDGYVSGANSSLFVNTLGWMCETEDAISISPINLDYNRLTVSSAAFLRIAVIFVGAIPLAIFVGGAIVLYKRKKR